MLLLIWLLILPNVHTFRVSLKPRLSAIMQSSENGKIVEVFSNYLKVDFSTFLSSECKSKIALCDEFNAQVPHKISSISERKLLALQKASTIASIGASTRIEGSLMTDAEVDYFLSEFSQKSSLSRDESEVFGYAEVLKLIFESSAVIPLSENTIKQLHSYLLAQSVKDVRHRGSYKSVPNNVLAYDANRTVVGVVFESATPFATPFKMSEIVEWTNDQLMTKKLHPLLVIAVFVVIFLTIHPFQDGNGRLSRLLTTLLMLKAGYTCIPFSSMENIIESNKAEYYLSLRQTQQSFDSNPNYSPWLNFFFDSVVKQQTALQRKLEQLNDDASL